MTVGEILWPAVAAYAVLMSGRLGSSWLAAHYAKPEQAGSEAATRRELSDLIARVESIELAGAMKPRSVR